mmetsp:Transcript_14774/g.34266  ORF Transcript_14774/g.34266 Transcript_14774/m.34266 type:complete len:85 (+) Transcript_14774:37-291(+)
MLLPEETDQNSLPNQSSRTPNTVSVFLIVQDGNEDTAQPISDAPPISPFHLSAAAAPGPDYAENPLNPGRCGARFFIPLAGTSH